MGAPASPSGSRATHEARSGLHPSGFDPSRIGDLPDRLFVAWIEEADDLPVRVLNLLYEAANVLADIRRAFK